MGWTIYNLIDVVHLVVSWFNYMRLLELNFTIPIIITFITASLGVLVLLNKIYDRRNILLFIVIELSACWVVCNLLADSATSYSASLFWSRLSILPPSIVLPTLLYFSFKFPRRLTKIHPGQLVLIYLPSIFYLIFFNTRFNISRVEMHPWGTSFTPGILYTLFIPYFLLFLGMAIYNFIKSHKSGSQEERMQIQFIILGITMAFIIGVTTNLILPFFEISKSAVLGPSVAILCLASANTYAILKHHLFNIKVIAAEILTFAIWIILLIQILVHSETHIPLFDVCLLLLTIIIGILLMKSVMSEVKQKESLQMLSNKLEVANIQLKVLDTTKSEFLGLASHQVKGPVTRIKNSASMLLEGSFGTMTNDKQISEIENILTSSKEVVQVIDDLLDVSKIEQGGLQLNKERIDLQDLLIGIIGNYRNAAVTKNLQLSFAAQGNGSYIINGDSLKIRQVFNNLIDNAIKYTENGWIKVTLSTKDSKIIQIKIRDTGIGIDAMLIPKLFEKFSRGNTTLSLGTGLGLYLAKKIIELHNGKIWVESKGNNKGSTFFVELPAL